MIKQAIMWVVDTWNGIMNAKYNPWRYIGDPGLQSYFMMVLFILWSAAFGLVAIFHFGWLGYSIPISIAVHLGLMIPLLITNAVFIDAERDGASWLAEWREDQSRIKIVTNRIRMKNMVRWDLDKEA